MDQEVVRQYATDEPLQVRIRTHELYSERTVDLDAACHRALTLEGPESLVDVGAGPGAFLRYLRGHGHTGPLLAVDQSMGMARKAATEMGAPAWAVVADAVRLPLREESLDRACARHMLYHVSDVPAAVSELHRVLKPGGVLVAATNSADTTPLIRHLTRALVEAFGGKGAEPTCAAFCIENAQQILRGSFSVVEPRVSKNALVFTTPEPIVDYVMTLVGFYGLPQDAKALADMREWLLAEVSRRLLHLGGTWRDPKAGGLFRCVKG
ncbi:MAG TPA: methyltransferase domain-containing protein [Armatimonadota bacterium]|jgi:ubiquinone/menaquinone biosynthesis C-methylase UbiE